MTSLIFNICSNFCCRTSTLFKIIFLCQHQILSKEIQGHISFD